MVDPRMDEVKMANGSLLAAVLFFIYTNWFLTSFTAEYYILVVNLYLVGTVVILGLSYRASLAMFTPYLVGFSIHAATLSGVLLLTRERLHASDPEIQAALTRIVFGVFVVWKLTANIRSLKLPLIPKKPVSGRAQTLKKAIGLLEGIIYPFKEFRRMVTILLYVTDSFYLITSSMNILEASSLTSNADFATIKKITTNVLYLAIQAPMMMASRASISRTFTEYIESKEYYTAMFQNMRSQLSRGYQRVLETPYIRFDRINSNGKHLWMSVFLLIALSVYEQSAVQFIEAFLRSITAFPPLY